MPGLPSLDGLAAVRERYDAIICDVWGVLHNGLRATPGAAEALIAARNAGVPVVLLTNAPRPPAPIEKQLAGFGISSSAYDSIISSGGVTRALLGAEGDKPFYHLGPARDAPIFEGLAARPAPLAEADYILCTGLFDDETETAEDYRPMLAEARARKLRLFCANPDLVVERGKTILPCAGAIALLYEEMGGEAIYVGKPHPLVYAHARAEIARLAGHEIPASRILCIGDALRTDVAGAIRAGHDALMILAGIHAHEIALTAEGYDGAALARLCAQNETRPTMSMASLVW
jgi:HAD superfamily hydrolase (TIGR01459 family)